MSELMKVSENTVPVPSALPQSEWPLRSQPLAPWWHTGLLVAIITGVSILSGMHATALGTLHTSNIHRYIVTLAWELVLALITLWGIYIRRTPLRQILGTRRSSLRDWALDAFIAGIFWIVALVVLGAIATVLRLVHLAHVQKAVIAIAPQNIPQVLLWLVLCIAAGIIEEFVFRGYLLQQFSSLPIGSARTRLVVAVLASSLLFGSAHGYEGIGGMIAITAYGAMFSILAIYRRSLRPGMIAHAWHDSITGIVLAIAKHARVI